MKFKYYLRGMGLGIIVTTILLAISFNVKGNEISDEEIISRAEKLGMEMKSRKVIRTDDILESELEEQRRAMEASERDAAGSENGGAGAASAEASSGRGVSERADSESNENASGSEKNSSEASLSGKNSETAASGKNSETAASGKNSETAASGKNSESAAAENSSETSASRRNSESAGAENSSEKTVSGFESRENSTQTRRKPEGTPVTITVSDGDGCRQVAEQLQTKGVITDSEDFRNYMSQHNLDSSIQNGTFTIPVGATYREISLIITRS